MDTEIGTLLFVPSKRRMLNKDVDDIGIDLGITNFTAISNRRIIKKT